MGDLWSTLNPIAFPAAGDRIALGTGPGVGGYALRGDFVWKNPASGFYEAGGDVRLTGAEFPRLMFLRNGIGNWSLGYSGTPGSNGFSLRLNDGAPVAFFDTGGRAGFGTSTPQKQVVVSSGGASGFEIEPGEGNYTRLLSYNRSTAAYTPVYIEASQIFFAIGGGGSVGIDSNQRLGVGTLSPGAKIHAVSSGEIGRFETTAASGGGNGYVSIHDSSSRKGYWGYGGLDDIMYLINERAAPLYFGAHGSVRWFMDDARFAPFADNGCALGGPSNRPNVIYAVSGTINTSDERQKVWLAIDEDQSVKWRRIARRLCDELGWYQLLDELARKGAGGARWHFGARAQRAWQIVAEEGLAPPLVDVGGVLLPDITWTGPIAPAWLCFDTWNEAWEPEYVEVIYQDEVIVGHEATGVLGPDGREIMRPIVETRERIEREPTGELIKTRDAGHLFGFRTDEMTMLIAWSLHHRLAAVEAAL